MNADPLADARAAGLTVLIDDLGSWSPAQVVSEYDRAARTIRVNERALAAVCGALGSAAYTDLVHAAVAHELYHHAVAEGTFAQACDRRDLERAAEHFARERYGVDAARFERALR